VSKNNKTAVSDRGKKQWTAIESSWWSSNLFNQVLQLFL